MVVVVVQGSIFSFFSVCCAGGWWRNNLQRLVGVGLGIDRWCGLEVVVDGTGGNGENGEK